MPNDFLYRLRLRDPDDEENYVDVLVCQAAALRDAKTGAQDYGLIFDNSENGGRITHRRVVENPSDPSQRIEVERIDGLVLRDAKGDGELRGYVVNNNDPPPRRAEPQPGDPAHIRTHVVRYCRDNDPDGVPWVDVERIDCLALRDAKDFSQEFALIADWPQAGAPIVDPDDPFEPRFCAVPESLWLDDRDYERINPPWRLDPLQNIVNVMWSGAVEFQTDTGDPHGTEVGVMLPGAARVVQPATTIEDFKRLTCSIWFNIPPDSPDLVPEWDGYSLAQWGGRPGGSSEVAGIGYPATSNIRLLVIDGETYDPRIQISLSGGTVPVTIPPGISWYDDHGYDSGGTARDSVLHSFARGSVPIDLVPEFFDRWHHLLISVDASENAFGEASLWISWNWAWEVTGIPDLNDPQSGGYRLEWNGILANHGWEPHCGVVGNTVTVDIRPRHIFDLTDDDLLPAHVIAAKARYRILYRANADDALRYGLYGVEEGTTLCNVYATFGSYNAGSWEPLKCQFVLDGQFAANGTFATYDAFFDDIAPDGRDGFVIRNLEPLGIPRQNNPQQAFDFATADVRTRLAKVQMWFGTFVDLENPDNVAKFLTVTTDPETGQRFGRPATLTADERRAAEEAGMLPERLVSPAALAFGAPHIYLDGGPASFPNNRGTGGEFIVVNDLEKFSPGPSRVPMPE